MIRNQMRPLVLGVLLLVLASPPTGCAAPPPPENIMVAPGDAEVRISWAAAPGATAYQVKRSATQTGEATVIASNLVSRSFTDTNVINGRNYFYAASASTDELEGPDSIRLRASPSAAVLDFLPAGAKVEKLATGFQFIEGPAWMASEGGFLVFSDINANRLIRWTPEAGAGTFRQPSGQANGNTVDRQGRLVTCEHQNRRVTRLEPDGSVIPLVTEYGGKRFNAPNDVVEKSDGTLWFTDPNYGSGQLQPGRYVFRLDPANGNASVTTVATDFDQPNGLCFSPDESLLYIADSGGPHHVRVFEVRPDNTLANGRVFAVISPGAPDGIRADSSGRLLVTAGDGVQIFSPDGTLLGKLRTPETAANVGFGGPQGDRVFITANTSLYGVTRSPDLVVTAISRFPASPTEGKPVRFLVTVKNQGTGPTTAGTAFRVALSIGTQTNLIQSSPWETVLPPDASVLLPCDAGHEAGIWTPNAGSYPIRAEADDLNVISESNERNNTLQLTVTVGTAPLDTDGDGLSDLDEAVAGTLPDDPASVLRILSATRTEDNALALTWSSVPGKSYRIECLNQATGSPWGVLPGVVPATAAQTTWTYPLGANSAERLFFRVLVLP